MWKIFSDMIDDIPVLWEFFFGFPFLQALLIIVAQTVDCFLNRKPSDLGLIIFSELRPGQDPVFRVMGEQLMYRFHN